MGNVSVLSENEIIEVIEEYVREDLYDYAIMLDGEWGCGKTYFVNKTLIPKLESDEKTKVIYLSLFGLKNTESLKEKILIQYGNAKAGKNSVF